MEFLGPNTGEKFVFLLFRKSGEIVEFNHWSQIKSFHNELKISSTSIQIFLRNGCIYPPYTIFSNVLMLPIGASLSVDSEDGSLKWINDFRYLDKFSRQDSIPSTSELKKKIGAAFEHLQTESRPIYMMQSAGKDSTAMLLGLKEIGLNNVHCVTYEANFRNSESVAAKKIATLLGFEHTTISPDYIKEFDALLDYQSNAINITADFSMLPYIAVNKYFFKPGSLVIDGLGNDLYMGYVSNKLERRIMKCSLGAFNRLEPSKFTSSELINYGLSSLFMKPYERLFPGTKLSVCEFEGFTKRRFLDKDSAYFNSLYKVLDKDDFRVGVRSRLCDSSMFQMKAELTTNSFGNEIYFPFSNCDLVNYYFNLPLEHRYDKANGVNKKLLRDMLQSEVPIDDFFKVKSGFRYDMQEFIKTNMARVKQQIISCDLLDSKYAHDWFDKHFDKGLVNYTSACKAYVLLVLSTWRSNNTMEVVDWHVAEKVKWY